MTLWFIMKSDTLIGIWILVYPIGIIEVTIPRKWSFWHYCSSLHDYCPPSTWNSLVRKAWGEIVKCEKPAFQLLKMRKKEICWNIKTKCVTDFLFTVWSSSMKDYTCHYELSTQKWNVYINFNKNNENLEIFFYR